MHSALLRVQNVFGYFTTVASIVAAVIALSVVISPQAPQASIKLRNVQVANGRPYYHSVKREEFANVRFDLDLDLSSLFSWNTKQIFVFIKAIYPPDKPGNPFTETIVWDAVLPSAVQHWHPNQHIHPIPRPASEKRSSSSSLHYTAKKVPGVLKLSNQKPRYQITDHTGKIANRGNATLELGWNIQPWVGALTWTNWNDWGSWLGLKGGRSKAFDFPAVPEKKGAKMDTAKGNERNKGIEA